MKLTFKASAFGGGMNTQHKYAKTVATLSEWAEAQLLEERHSHLRVTLVRLYAKADTNAVSGILTDWVLLGEYKFLNDVQMFIDHGEAEGEIARLSKRAAEFTDAADSLIEARTLA